MDCFAAALLAMTVIMRLAFMGTPDFAVPTLDALLEAGHEVVAVYTQPPRPGGRRGKELTPSPVHRRAEAAGIEVRTPARLRGEEEQAAFAALGLDAAVVAAYGLILPEPILRAPRHGCLNVHASLLPRWRGAAPIQRAILAGDEKTGVCIMAMEKGLDTGPVFARGETEIGRKTAGELTVELANMGGALMVDVLERIEAIVPEPQPDEGVTYAHKIEKSEAELDFVWPAKQVERYVRAFNPSPGAFFILGGERIKILEAAALDGGGLPGFIPPIGNSSDFEIECSQGSIYPTIVQRAGRPAMKVEDFLRGFNLFGPAYIDGYPPPPWR